MLQLLWQSKLDWDQDIPSQLQKKWQSFQGELPLLNYICIPRQIIITQFVEFELHGFSDASEQAYVAAILESVLEAQIPRTMLSYALCVQSLR